MSSPLSKTTPIEQVVIDRFVGGYRSETRRIAARKAIELARRIAPERFPVPNVEPDPHGPHPSLSAEQIDHARQLIEGDSKPVAEVARLLGVHRATLYQALGTTSLEM